MIWKKRGSRWRDHHESSGGTECAEHSHASGTEKVIDQVEADDEIYVCVLTGAGRSFVAGADIGEMSAFGAVEGKKFGDYGNSVFLKIENMSKPIIAAINGFALGGGCELSMACDIRQASEKGKVWPA